LRDRSKEIEDLGGRIVAVGTGNARHAQAFIEDEKIPFAVLVDDDAAAARVASIERVAFYKLFDPASYPATLRAWQGGHRLGIPGRRTNQLGATFVIGPGNVVRYEHRDGNTVDHAPMGAVFAALRS
jgi:peroxiredoxin